MGNGDADAAPVSLGDRLVGSPGREGIALADGFEEVGDGCGDVPGSRLHVDPNRTAGSEGDSDGEVVMGDGEMGLPRRAAGAPVSIPLQSRRSRLATPGAQSCAKHPCRGQAPMPELRALARGMQDIFVMRIDASRELHALLIREGADGDIDALLTYQSDGLGQVRVDVLWEGCVYSSSPRSTTASRRSRSRSCAPSSGVNSSRMRCSTFRALSSARSTSASPAAVSVTTLTRL